MDRKTACDQILAAKRAKGTSWEALAKEVGMAEVYIASCVYGENSMSEDVAAKFCKALDLGPDVKNALVTFPMKGQSLGQLVPTDPLVYRFYEIMQVYGAALKDVIQEKFGDGIMSAIDFKLDVTKESNPKGDRVVVTMNGKFLPYVKW
ncbi:MAG TPA: cyanase [Polyangiaceae bacterium]|nr:cyanase [Polyangiaceae bacterium]